MDRRKFVVTRALTQATLFPVKQGGERVDVPAGTKVFANWDAQPKLGLVVVRLPEDDSLWLAKRQDFERAPETFNGDQATSDFLKEYWHATARAPRDYPGAKIFGVYDWGVDVLGASGLRVAKAGTAVKSAASAATAAATPAAAKVVYQQQAAPSAPKGVYRPGVAQASRVPSHGTSPATRAAARVATKAVAKAAAAKRVELSASQKKAVVAAGKKLRGAQGQAQSAARRAIASAQRLVKKRRGRASAAGKRLAAVAQKFMQDAAKATSVRGDGEPTVQQIKDMTVALMPRIRILGALADASDLASELDPLITQAEGADLTDIAAAGVDVYNRCVDVVNQASDVGVDEGVVTVVAQIKTDAAAWKEQLRAALAAGPTAAPPGAETPPETSPAADGAQSFDPGTSGGGGGGGGGGDESAFADEGEGGGGGVPSGGGTSEEDWPEADAGGGGEGAFAEDGEGMAPEDAVAEFRQSGGAWDPFSEETAPYDGGDRESSLEVEEFPEDAYATEEESSEPEESPELAEFREGGDPFAEPEDGESVSGSVPSGTDVESTIRSIFDTSSPTPTYSETGDSPATKTVRGQPSPEVAARLGAAQKRAADAKAQLAAQHVDRASAPTASTPTESPVAVEKPSFAERVARALAKITGGA